MRSVARISPTHKDFIHFTTQATAFYLIAQLEPGRGRTLRFRYLENNPDMDSSIRSLTRVAKRMVAEPGTTQEKIASMTMHNFDIWMKKGPIRNGSFDIK